MAIYQHILLAVDLTPQALQIGYRARALAEALDAELEIFSVVEPISTAAPIPPDAVVPDLVTTQAELIDAAEQHVSWLARELGVPETNCRVSVGNIKSEIIRVAVDEKVDLIVIGSRQRHGLAFLIKPTEDVVVHRAPCDVLAVRLTEQHE
jgi:universal stress protein A